MKEWGIQINYGIKTGLNEAFIIDEKTKNQLISEDPKSVEIIRPILRGRDIDKYTCNFANLYIGIKENGVAPISISEYPAVKKYLDKYKDKLSKRQDQGITPYNLRNCAYMEDFFKQKIIYPETTQSAKFYLDDAGYFADKTCFIMIADKPKYLVATLSSSLFEYAYKKIFSSIALGVNGYQYNKQAIVELPIHIPSAEEEKMVNNLFDRLIKCNCEEKESNQVELDVYIASLYNISIEELKKIRL